MRFNNGFMARAFEHTLKLDDPENPYIEIVDDQGNAFHKPLPIYKIGLSFKPQKPLLSVKCLHEGRSIESMKKSQ